MGCLRHRFLVASGLVLGLSGCSSVENGPSGAQKPPSDYENVAAGVEFVGDVACASCHEEEYSGFQDHGMANSYYPLTTDNAVETYPGSAILDSQGQYRYQSIRVGDRFFQEETLVGSDGELLHRLRREMQFVMGSGTTARTYFAENQGFLYQLPLTWYTQEERWDFSPGYRVANKRFGRQVPDRCMACHNSYPQSVAHAPGKYDIVPEGIGCERCHGPGELHVAERLAVPDPVNEVDSTIVNPAHLTLDRRLDVCQQCHLHTTVSLLRDGRQPFDFRPSHALEDFLALYADPAPESSDEIGVISHAERMKRSACFVETVASGGSFECTTCHDPHAGFRTAGPAYFNQTCLDCHSPTEIETIAAHSAEANCITCHMPRVEAAEAPHSSFTDHHVRVVGTREGSETGQPSRPAAPLEPYFTQDREAPDPMYDGMALVVLGRRRASTSLTAQGAELLDRLTREGAIVGEAHFLRGMARLELGDPQAALEGLEAAVAADPDIPERLNALAQALEAVRGDAGRIESLYARAVEVQPARADIWVNYGRFLESLGRLGDAMAAYETATREQPWLAAAHYNLGTARARSGGLPQALEALRQAVRLEPKDAQIWGNLGAVFGQLSKPDSALFAFQRAVQAAPADPVALGNLGAFHLNSGAYRAAIDYLAQAVEANPNFADALANRALAHLQLEERASARLYARRALDAQPGHTLATQILSALQ